LVNREAFDRLKALGRYGQPRPAADDRTTTMAAMQVADLMSPRSDGSSSLPGIDAKSQDLGECRWTNANVDWREGES